MKISVTGAEFKAFYMDETVWSQDGAPAWYVEDMEIHIKGDTHGQDPHDVYGDQLERLPDDASVTVRGGWLAWQGRGNPPPGKEQDLVKAITRWKAYRNTVLLTATFEIDSHDSERLARLQEWLMEQGGKIVRSDGQEVLPAAHPSASTQVSKPR